jgi:hypothetical protein
MKTIVRHEKRQRGPFGFIIKWLFILFNLFMVWGLFSGIHNAASIETASDAERAGQAIGMTIGVSMILGIWAFGTIILGLLVLLTRGNTVIIEER